MTPDRNHQPDDLTTAVAEAFDRAPLPPRPDTAQTLRWLEEQEDAGESTSENEAGEGMTPVYSFKRRFAMRVLSPLAAAALLAIVAGVLLWTPSAFDGNAVFAEAVRHVRAAQTMAFTMTMPMPGQDQTATMRAKLKNPGSMRIDTTLNIDGERVEMTQLFDVQKQEMLTLIPAQKFAQRIDMAGMPRGENPHDVVAQFRELDPTQATYVRDERMNGVEAHLYRIEAGAMRGRTWIDAESKLPVRMEFGNPATPDDPDATLVMADFQWDIAVDDAAFEMKVPEGYQVRTMDMSHGGPDDLARLLRVWAVMSEQPFPDRFGPDTVTGLNALLFKPELTREQNVQRLRDALSPTYGDMDTDKQFEEAMMRFGADMGRGAIFLAGLAETATDWQWVGGGATAGDGDTALCYWKPNDADKYLVIYNDFTVRKVAADELPEPPQP